MGYIKEPAGINFIVDPTPLTEAERRRISEVIAYYKATGKKLTTKKCLANVRGEKGSAK